MSPSVRAFDFRVGQIALYRQQPVTTSIFFRSCAAQALSRGEASRHSLHSSAYYCEYNEDLTFESEHQPPKI